MIDKVQVELDKPHDKPTLVDLNKLR